MIRATRQMLYAPLEVEELPAYFAAVVVIVVRKLRRLRKVQLWKRQRGS
jgi:hypothetical protein